MGGFRGLRGPSRQLWEVSGDSEYRAGSCGRFQRIPSNEQGSCGRFQGTPSTEQGSCGRFQRIPSNEQGSCGRFQGTPSTEQAVVGGFRGLRVPSRQLWEVPGDSEY